MKEYKAIIWIGEKRSQRVCCVLAENATEAKEKLEAQYGEGRVYFVQHDEDEAARRRFVPQGAIGPDDGAVRTYRAIIWSRNNRNSSLGLRPFEQ